MKTFLLFLVLTIVQLISVFADAYILPLDTILQKTTELAGNKIISVEQNVIFKDGKNEYTIKEEWLIEGDKNLKLKASGVGELKNFFKVHYLYNNKKRTELSGKNKVVTDVTRELFERYLAIKSVGSYLSYLKDLGISDKVRLSRAGGTVSFAIGEPSTAEALSPQIWIDQDFFHLLKIRFPSEADIEFSNYKEYGDIHYPRLKVVTWADKSVVIKVKKVTVKTAASIKSFYSDTLDLPTEIMLASKGDVGLKIEEFYKRFR